MKRRGFTLAEVLITLAIIGVVAAAMAPTIGNLIPDKNKAQVIKIYKTIADINESLLNNPSLYYSGGSNCQGFACFQQPLDSPYNIDSKYSGNTKYPYLLASHLQTTKDPVASGTGIKFTTVDGIDWYVGYSSSLNKIQIEVDLNGDEEPNKVYSTKCDKPDTFMFTLNPPDGKLQPGDALTDAYLKNPVKLNDKKKDYKTAESITWDYPLNNLEAVEGLEAKPAM